MAFRPNRLMFISFNRDAIERLKVWQLLVAVCHFGPDMADCRRLDYWYIMVNGTIYCGEPGSNKRYILDEIKVNNPGPALEEYAGFDWKKWAKDRLKGEWKK